MAESVVGLELKTAPIWLFAHSATLTGLPVISGNAKNGVRAAIPRLADLNIIQCSVLRRYIHHLCYDIWWYAMSMAFSYGIGF